MSQAERAVFFVSDHTGITAEVLGHSLLTQFEGVSFRFFTRPFINSVEKVRDVIKELDGFATPSGERPIVFTTLIDSRLLTYFNGAYALHLNLFSPFLGALEGELQRPLAHRVGRYHSIIDLASYQLRMDTIDFALTTDDGLGTQHYERADIILVGVSRVGKTPTCLYLALQYGVRAANYPLADDDFEKLALPTALEPFQDRLFGLTIDPLRLHHIRSERKPGSRYADLDRCAFEVKHAERLCQAEGIRSLNTTTRSMEEIAATLMQAANLKRRLR